MWTRQHLKSITPLRSHCNSNPQCMRTQIRLICIKSLIEILYSSHMKSQKRMRRWRTHMMDLSSAMELWIILLERRSQISSVQWRKQSIVRTIRIKVKENHNAYVPWIEQLTLSKRRKIKEHLRRRLMNCQFSLISNIWRSLEYRFVWWQAGWERHRVTSILIFQKVLKMILKNSICWLI